MPADQVLYQVHDDLLVSEDGELIRAFPRWTVVRDADDVSNSVEHGAPSLQLFGGGGGGPVTGDPKYQIPKLSIDVAEKTAKLIAESAKVVSSIVSIVGIADAVIQMLELSGLFGHKTDLDDVLEHVKYNYIATVDASKIAHLQHMAPAMGAVAAARAALETYKRNPGKTLRDEIVAENQTMAGVVRGLLDSSYQDVLMNFAEYAPHPWFFDSNFLSRTPQTGPYLDRIRTRYPEVNIRPIPDFGDHDVGDRFDYRFVLGNIVAAVTTRLWMMKVVEPEFRSTGRFRVELREIVVMMRSLQANWYQSIQSPPSAFDDPYEGQLNDFPAWDYYRDVFGRWYIPVGAVDICTGLAVWGKIELEQPPWTGVVPNGVTKPYFKDASHRQAVWNEAIARRQQARQQVMQASGYAAFVAFVGLIESLTEAPDQSETVDIREGARFFPTHLDGYIRETSQEVKTAGGLICDEREFPFAVWELIADVSTTLRIRTQTPESIDTFVIQYEFLLASGGGSATLTPGTHTLQLRVQQFSLQVGPAGEHREVGLPSGDVTLVYTLSDHGPEGYWDLDLESPTRANMRFQLQVREKIESGDLLVTSHDVELVARHERLPSEYFRYLSDCHRTQSQLFGRLNQLYAISEREGEVPGFDPRRHSPTGYLEEVQRRYPEVVRQELASLDLSR